MEHVKLGMPRRTGITILIFMEGTVLKPRSWLSQYDFRKYIPVGSCINKIEGWYKQGANIIYCTSRRKKKAEEIARLLNKYGFAGSELYYRGKVESYKDIVEKIRPDVLIEDDCRSIGGARQMCITHVDPRIKENIVSVVVREFKGIDDLPEDISVLISKQRE